LALLFFADAAFSAAIPFVGDAPIETQITF